MQRGARVHAGRAARFAPRSTLGSAWLAGALTLALSSACGSNASLEDVRPHVLPCYLHGSLDVAPAPTTGKAGVCATCHMADFRSAPHHLGERPTTCAICHSQDGWHPSRLDHAWPLTGAHAKASCFECHSEDPPVFEGTKSSCIDCHRSDYEKAPEHVARSFPTTCQECHGTAAWKPLLPEASPPAAEPVPSPSTLRSSSEPTSKPASTPRPTPHPSPSHKPVPTPPPSPPPDVTTRPSPIRKR